MTTPSARSLAFLAAAMLVSLSACAGAPPRSSVDGPSAAQPRALTVRFDNEALDPVDVYLIDGQREWRLGRVAPGARANLRIPEASIGNPASYVQIAVVPTQGRNPMGVRGSRATLSIAQPAGAILSQRFKFSDGQVHSLRLSTTRAGAAQP